MYNGEDAVNRITVYRRIKGRALNINIRNLLGQKSSKHIHPQKKVSFDWLLEYQTSLYDFYVERGTKVNSFRYTGILKHLRRRFWLIRGG